VFGDKPLVTAKAAITSGVWHHAAYTFDRSSNTLYVDGELVASSTDLPDKRTPTTCWLGTLDGTRDLFVGRMDDVHVFETARTAAQVALAFGGEFSSNLPGLVLDLPFDESAGNVVFDPPNNKTTASSAMAYRPACRGACRQTYLAVFTDESRCERWAERERLFARCLRRISGLT